MKKIQSIILFSIIFTLITISTTFTVLAENPNTLKPKIDPNIITRGTPALLFTIEDVLTETIFSFESFKGKVVVLDFFSTTCLYEDSIPELKNAKAKYSSDDLEIISIDVDLNDTETDIEHFASDFGISWKMVSDTLGINTYYQLITIPTFYVIDQDQYIYQAIFGLFNFDELDGFILELLPEYSSSPNPSNGNGTPSEFWGKNWYWFLLSGVIFVIVTGLVIQRRRIVLHNRKVRAQKMDARQRRVRKRER